MLCILYSVCQADTIDTIEQPSKASKIVGISLTSAGIGFLGAGAACIGSAIYLKHHISNGPFTYEETIQNERKKSLYFCSILYSIPATIAGGVLLPIGIHTRSGYKRQLKLYEKSKISLAYSQGSVIVQISINGI
jgi:hypothetical protein